MIQQMTNRELAQEINARIGNAPIPFDSVYSIALQIYQELGGEENDFDSVYSILLEILPLAESVAKKTSITEVDALPDAQEDKNTIYRLSSNDKVYMSVRYPDTMTNRLPDEQQINKACLKDSDNEPKYYKGTYKVICSDGEINGYGWYSYDGEYWYMYISDVNAEHITENEAVYTLGDEELTLVLNQENKTITASDYTIAELQADWREVLKDMNLYPIPATYNAPESAQIGNATLVANGENGIYTGEQISFMNDNEEITGYKWTDEDDSDYCFVTLKPASEIYFTKVDNVIYTDLGEYPVYYLDITNPENPILDEQLKFDDLYIPQLNAPDAQQIDNAYINTNVLDNEHCIYKGVETTIQYSGQTITGYTWVDEDKNLTCYSTKRAFEIYNANKDSVDVQFYNNDGGIFETTFADGNLLSISTVKYQRTEKVWDWEKVATEQYVDATIKTLQEYIASLEARIAALENPNA